MIGKLRGAASADRDVVLHVIAGGPSPCLAAASRARSPSCPRPRSGTACRERVVRQRHVDVGEARGQLARRWPRRKGIASTWRSRAKRGRVGCGQGDLFRVAGTKPHDVVASGGSLRATRPWGQGALVHFISSRCTDFVRRSSRPGAEPASRASPSLPTAPRRSPAFARTEAASSRASSPRVRDGPPLVGGGDEEGVRPRRLPPQTSGRPYRRCMTRRWNRFRARWISSASRGACRSKRANSLARMARSPCMPLRRSMNGRGQVGQRPVQVRAAGLLEHLLERADGDEGDGEADEVADERRVFAQVAGQGEHRLGRADRGVEAPSATSARNRTSRAAASESHLLNLGQEQVDALVLELEQDLPVRRVEAGGVGRPAQGEPP